MALTLDQRGKAKSSLLTNLFNRQRGPAERLVERYPFLYIRDRAFNAYGREVKGSFALHTTDLERSMEDVFAYFAQLEAEGNQRSLGESE